MKTQITAAAAALVIFGCATPAHEITPAYVSPVQYANLDCQQISAELMRISSAASHVGARLDSAASNDKTITVAGTLLFWPALFFLGGTKQQESEYARLRGEYDALAQSANLKKCFEQADPQKTKAGIQPAPAATPAPTAF